MEREKAGNRGEQLTSRMDAAKVELKKAVKEYFSIIQKEVDKTTQFLTDYLRADMEAIKWHRLRTYAQHLIVIIAPAVEVTANDIAPKYAIKSTLKFHLFAFVRGFSDEKGFWISGDCMVLQATGLNSKCIEASNLTNKLKQLSAHGIEVVLAEPKKKRRKMIEDLIKKNNMIERFAVISPNNSEINSSPN